MEDKNTKRYMELQMEELKEACATEAETTPKSTKPKSGDPRDAEIAELYEDAWEYEEELAYFEEALKVIEASTTKDMVASLSQAFPEEKSFVTMLKTVLEDAWTNNSKQQELIQASAFDEVVSKLSDAFPNYEGDFEEEVKEVIVTVWKTHISVKKDHIKEETNYIKALGLKPHYAKKIYKRYHGIE